MYRTGIFLAMLLTTIHAAWAGMEDDVARVRQQWERIKYQTPAKAQEDAYEKLVKESAQIVQQYPKHAEPAIWHGIVEASYAGAKRAHGLHQPPPTRGPLLQASCTPNGRQPLLALFTRGGEARAPTYVNIRR